MTRFILHTDRIRENALRAVREAPEGYIVTIAEPTRSVEQNALFHSLCSDIAKSGHPFKGKTRDAAEWKVLLVSGHAIATDSGFEIIAGIENEWVNIRESTANMGVKRASSLIEYTIAYCEMNDIPINDTRAGGFMEGREE